MINSLLICLETLLIGMWVVAKATFNLSEASIIKTSSLLVIF